MTVRARIAGLAVATAIGVALAGCTTQGITTPVTAEASPTVQQSTDDPPCGFDVYRGKVYVTSLGKAHGTARVIRWTKPYRYDGTPRGIGTLVGTKRIKAGQSITIKRPKGTKANRITVDIVRGKLTRNESRRKAWHCEAA